MLCWIEIQGRSERGVPSSPQSKCCLAFLRTVNEQITDFWLKFSWDMPKMHYFSNKFSKIFQCWGASPPAPFNLQFWWSEVARFGQIMVFEIDYDEIKHKKSAMTPFQSRLRHRNSGTKMFHFGPLQSKFLATLVLNYVLNLNRCILICARA